MQFLITKGYFVDYKEIYNGVFTGVIYGPEIENGSQAVSGYSVDQIINDLKKLADKALIPNEAWDALSERIKGQGYK